MDYFSLKCFVEVVRSGSFSKAAYKLFRTQPAISLQIRKLENELKQPLLDRYKKKIVLTEAGQVIYEQAKDLLDKLDDLNRLASRAQREPQGTLTIASNLSLINNFLPPFIGAFHKKCPQVKIVLLNLTAERIAKVVLDGNADIGLGYLIDNSLDISRQKIIDSGFILVSRKDPVKKMSLKETLKGTLIHFEEGIDLRVYIERNLRLNSTLKVMLELPSIESILHYIKFGFGYSILPDFSVLGHWKKEFCFKDLSEFIPPLTISAYTHKKRIISKAAEEFLNAIVRLA